MKTYPFELNGRQRFMGYSTDDPDVSISYFYGDEIVGEDLHYHTESDEIMITVKGRARVWIEGDIHELKPGFPIRIEKGEKHKVLDVLEAPVEYYVVKVPDTSDDKVVVEDILEI